MACTNERKREVLPLNTKWAVLKRLQKGMKPSLLLQEFNCRKSTISEFTETSQGTLQWWRNKSEAVSRQEIKMTRKMTKTSHRPVCHPLFLCLSMSMWWLEAQTDHYPISVQLSVSYNRTWGAREQQSWPTSIQHQFFVDWCGYCTGITHTWWSM